MTPKAKNITFVISNFGHGSLQPDGSDDPFIGALKNSITQIYPDSQILVSCNELPDTAMATQLNSQIESVRDNCKFLRESPGSLKLLTHFYAWNFIKTEWAVFLDSDMLLVKPIDEYLTEDVDYIFAWRKKDMSIPGEWPWLNAGTMMCRNTEPVRRFWASYYNLMWKHAMFERGDQFAFVELLQPFNEAIGGGRELFKHPPSQKFSFKLHDISFRAVHCDYINRSSPYEPWFEGTAIQHLKGVQGTIITKTQKENRYDIFLNNTLGALNDSQRNNLKIRIDLWKKFAPPEVAETVIDL